MKKLQAMSESIEDTVQVYSPGTDNEWRLKQERPVYGATSSPSPAKPTPDQKSTRPALARLDRPYYGGGQLGRRGYNTRIDEREEEDLIREVRRTRRTRVYVDPDMDYVDEDGACSLPHHDFTSHRESRIRLDQISEDDPFFQPMGAAHFRNGTLNTYHGQQVSDGLHSLAVVAANSAPVISNTDNSYGMNGLYSQQHQQNIQGNTNGYAMQPAVSMSNTNAGYPIVPNASYRYGGPQNSRRSQPGFNTQFGYGPQESFETRCGFASNNTFNHQGASDPQRGFGSQNQFQNQQQQFQYGDNRCIPSTLGPTHARNFSNGIGFGNGKFHHVSLYISSIYWKLLTQVQAYLRCFLQMTATSGKLDRLTMASTTMLLEACLRICLTSHLMLP